MQGTLEKLKSATAANIISSPYSQSFYFMIKLGRYILIKFYCSVFKNYTELIVKH